MSGSWCLMGEKHSSSVHVAVMTWLPGCPAGCSQRCPLLLKAQHVLISAIGASFVYRVNGGWGGAGVTQLLPTGFQRLRSGDGGHAPSDRGNAGNLPTDWPNVHTRVGGFLRRVYRC
jgi:hypothetical protein